MTHDPQPPPKPDAADLGELPPPMMYAIIDDRPDHPLHRLSGPLWLVAGVAIAVTTLGIPGCMSGGAPAVSARADVSVKETGLIARGGMGGGAANPGVSGGGGTGELTANLSISMTWPSKSK